MKQNQFFIASTSSESTNNTSWPRRKFISAGLQVTGLAALSTLPLPAFAEEGSLPVQKEYIVTDIIELVLKGCGFADNDKTVDIIKAGERNMKVTGIVTTMFATIELIQKAIKLNANLIIVHEPTFYSGNRDERSWVESSDVINRKMKLLKDNNICIWRAHDSIHTIKPDGVTKGVVQQLGWDNYFKGEKTFSIPPMRFKELIKHLKTKLGIEHVRVIGNAKESCSKICLLPGAWGGKMQMTTIMEDKPDVLIVGELSEWETAEYVRDARLLGDKISLVVLGHSLSEEPGMQWMAEWLKPQLPGLPITHIIAGNPLQWA